MMIAEIRCPICDIPLTRRPDPVHGGEIWQHGEHTLVRSGLDLARGSPSVLLEELMGWTTMLHAADDSPSFIEEPVAPAPPIAEAGPTGGQPPVPARRGGWPPARPPLGRPLALTPLTGALAGIGLLFFVICFAIWWLVGPLGVLAYLAGIAMVALAETLVVRLRGTQAHDEHDQQSHAAADQESHPKG